MAKVYAASIFQSRYYPNGCLRLYWIGNEGCGQYDLSLKFNYSDIVDPDYQLKFEADSECMDDNQDKSFIKELLLSLIDTIEIKG